MKTTLLLATNNKHKAEEIRAVIGEQFRVITLTDAGINTDIPEPHDTIEANALEKSRFIYKLTGENCFGDDTGLEVKALNGAPGVKSARYAGEQKSFDANIEKLLSELKGIQDREAEFKTVIALIWHGQEHLFEGITKGRITHERRGQHGFGYDPVFVPEGSEKTFGEMNLDEKNIFSHRKKATDKLIDLLKNI